MNSIFRYIDDYLKIRRLKFVRIWTLKRAAIHDNYTDDKNSN